MTHRKRRKRDTAEAMAPPAPVGRLFRAFRNNVKGEKKRMTPFRETNRITSPYGWRTYTNAAGKTIREHHNGIDVVPTRYPGESVTDDAWDFREVTGGRVIEVSTGWNSGRGTLIKVQTAPGVIEFYQHCAAVYVKVGQQVPQGTVLGRAGATGNVTGAHLHFEVQVNGSPVEPSAWLGLPNAARTYPGNDTLDNAPAQDTDDAPANSELSAIQLVSLAPLTDDQVRQTDALAESLGLADSDHYKVQRVDDSYFAVTATVSNGDAVRVLQLAQEEGWDKRKLYHSRFVG